jgi:hypothetical protein
MTRRTTVNRTHRTARRKQPKTIQDARELILAMVPNGFRVYVYAHWHDSREMGHCYSSVGYSCSVYGAAGKEIIDVQSPTPPGLVGAVYNAFAELHVKAAAEAAAAAAAKNRAMTRVADPIEGEIVEDDEPRNSPPRLALQLPLLTDGRT